MNILSLEDIGIYFTLIPDLNAYQNIIFSGLIDPLASGISENLDYLMECLDLIIVIERFPDSLSGDEKQRVAIPRAMIDHWELLLADEPTGNLYEKTGKNIYSLHGVVEYLPRLGV
jgi:putative ABC transport system ATP-binding protein